MFKKIKVMLDYGAITPTRAHADDAGLDLYSPGNEMIPPGGSVVIETGVHIQIPKGYMGKIEARSGLNVRHDIICTGVIDAGYAGQIIVKLYNLGDGPYTVHTGDRIAQLVILPCETPDVEVVDSFIERTERGNNGIGSSGK